MCVCVCVCVCVLCVCVSARARVFHGLFKQCTSKILVMHSKTPKAQRNGRTQTLLQQSKMLENNMLEPIPRVKGGKIWGNGWLKGVTTKRDILSCQWWSKSL